MEKRSEIESINNAGVWMLFAFLKNIIITLRPKDWAKNLFLYIPIFFSGDIFKSGELIETTWGVISFSLVASSIYILNDYKDIEKDKLHPTKCKRPIAAGKISTILALFLITVCAIMGFSLALIIDRNFSLVLAIYFILNIAYSLGLKNISILDIFILAAGFVLRVKAGGTISAVGISQWLMIMVFLLSLFLALSKRRDDVILQEKSGREMRKSISGYNLEFLNVSLAIVSAIIIIAYLMYTLSPEVIDRLGTYRIYYTGVFVMAGLMRYLQVIYIKNDTGSPTKILYEDHFIQACMALWILSFYLLLYYPDLHFYK